MENFIKICVIIAISLITLPMLIILWLTIINMMRELIDEFKNK